MTRPIKSATLAARIRVAWTRPLAIREGRRRRLDRERREEDERVLLRVYQQGFNARMDERSCAPPAGYRGAIGLDFTGTWTAGWEAADRVLREDG